MSETLVVWALLEFDTPSRYGLLMIQLEISNLAIMLTKHAKGRHDSCCGGDAGLVEFLVKKV